MNQIRTAVKQWKLNRLADHQMKWMLVDPKAIQRHRVGRHHAHGLRWRLLDEQVVGPSKPRIDTNSFAPTHLTKVGCPLCHCQIQSIPFEDSGLPGIPRLKPFCNLVKDRLSDLGGFQDAAVEENPVGSSGSQIAKLLARCLVATRPTMLPQKGSQVLVYVRVGRVRQSKLLKSFARFVRSLLDGHTAKKTIYQQFSRPAQIDRYSSSVFDEFRSTAGQRHFVRARRLRSKQRFLGGSALCFQCIPLPRSKSILAR